jgi:tRNA U34 5-methylaminomethyl-2-thiouridine-forming methyltransferase MnmC
MESGKLKLELVLSDDGSHTIHIPELKEHYHSHKGAIQESSHVFIEMGLNQSKMSGQLKVLEVGFGTGLNALLTRLNRGNKAVHYIGLEPFPLDVKFIEALNYGECIGGNAAEKFTEMHHAAWDKLIQLENGFSLEKLETRLENFKSETLFDLVYYDAFAPHAQPELWTLAIWTKLFRLMKSGGNLVTYCAKGQVRRDMQQAGFDVERLQGPPGKREMLRCTKP